MMLITALFLAALPAAVAEAPRELPPIQVYILAGQSNMVGKARLTVLEHQIKDPESAPRFAHLHKDGEYIERDDVTIDFLERRGPLTTGYGSPDRIGPELEFGHVMGDHHEAPVLIIKTAWGGKSLWRDFRSPGAGLPSDETLQELLTPAQKKKPDTSLEDIQSSFGANYRAMLKEIDATLKDLPAMFPDAESRGHELAGFAWFQGWNDMIDGRATAEYAANMERFIDDVRKDLKAPDLPFVIGQFGVGGLAADNPKHLKFKAAQAAPAKLAKFKGNVALVKTDAFWDVKGPVCLRQGLEGPPRRMEPRRLGQALPLPWQPEDDVRYRRRIRGGLDQVARRRTHGPLNLKERGVAVPCNAPPMCPEHLRPFYQFAPPAELTW